MQVNYHRALMMTVRSAACGYLLGRVKSGMVLKVSRDLKGWHREHAGRLAYSLCLCFAWEVPLPVEHFLCFKVVHQPLTLERLDRPL